MCQGGDFIKGDGTGSMSIYGPNFKDENLSLKHTGPGLLSMVPYFLHVLHLHILTARQKKANSGPDTNGCQFFVTCAAADFLDGKHVVFGKLIDGLLTLRKIENVPTGQTNRPKLNVVISECGEM